MFIVSSPYSVSTIKKLKKKKNCCRRCNFYEIFTLSDQKLFPQNKYSLAAYDSSLTTRDEL